jgi:hypothetical protein
VFGHRVFQLQGGYLVEELSRITVSDEQTITAAIEC